MIFLKKVLFLLNSSRYIAWCRLQNSRFFLKISKEIGKAWRKSLTRASLTRRERLSPVSLSVFSLIPDLLFDCSRVLEYAKIQTVLQSMLVDVLGGKESFLDYKSKFFT